MLNYWEMSTLTNFINDLITTTYIVEGGGKIRVRFRDSLERSSFTFSQRHCRETTNYTEDEQGCVKTCEEKMVKY